MPGQLPGWLGAGENAVRERLVVPRSARRHGTPAERALEHGAPVSLRGHADRLAELPLLLRHDYFRRLLCNLLGKDVERGLLPNDRVFWASWSKGLLRERARLLPVSTRTDGSFPSLTRIPNSR